MLWRVPPSIRSRLKPAGFILPCQPALAGSAATASRLAARDQVRRLSSDCPQDDERVRLSFGLIIIQNKNPAN
jgi:hypothetical protein